MKRLLIVVSVLLLLPNLSSCGIGGMTESVSTTAMSPETDAADLLPENLTAEDFLQDYDKLWEDLENNFPYVFLLEEQVDSLDAVKEEYRSMVSGARDIYRFSDILNRMFGRLGQVAHLSLISPDAYQILTQSDDIRDSDAWLPWRTVLEEEKTASVYRRLREISGNPAVTNNSQVQFRYYDELDTAYFYFPQMYDGEDDIRILPNHLSSYPDVKNIIFDLTGNVGGSTLYWSDVIVRPFGGSWTANYPVYFQDTPINAQFYPLETYTRIIPENETEHAALLAELNAVYKNTVSVELDCGESVLGDAQDAARYVLVDDRCYSATEQFAVFCKLSGWAKVIGERSAGDGMGGQAVLLPLENTGLLVQFTTEICVNPDGTLNAVQGILPDILVNPKTYEMPLEVCLRYIESKNLEFQEKVE